jgi:hypothetical protein
MCLFNYKVQVFNHNKFVVIVRDVQARCVTPADMLEMNKGYCALRDKYHDLRNRTSWATHPAAEQYFAQVNSKLAWFAWMQRILFETLDQRDKAREEELYPSWLLIYDRPEPAEQWSSDEDFSEIEDTAAADPEAVQAAAAANNYVDSSSSSEEFRQ